MWQNRENALIAALCRPYKTIAYRYSCAGKERKRERDRERERAREKERVGDSVNVINFTQKQTVYFFRLKCATADRIRNEVAVNIHRVATPTALVVLIFRRSEPLTGATCYRRYAWRTSQCQCFVIKRLMDYNLSSCLWASLLRSPP